jgi:hypothetical protein
VALQLDQLGRVPQDLRAQALRRRLSERGLALRAAQARLRELEAVLPGCPSPGGSSPAGCAGSGLR